MEQQRKSIDDLFREELGGYTEAPPSGAWAAFEKKLDSAPPKGGLFDRWSAYIGVACLLLLLSVTVAVKINGNTSRSTATAMNSATGAAAAQSNATSTSSATASAADNTAKNIADKPGNTVAANNNSTTANSSTPPANSPTNNNTSTTNHTNNSANNNTTHTGNNHLRTTNNNHYKTHSYAAKTGQASGSKATNSAGNNRNTAEANEPHNANVYNSSATEGNTKETDTNGAATEKKEDKALPPVAKKEIPGVSKPTAKKQTPKKPVKPPFKKFFEAGVKLGYETGFNNDAAKKGVISPYVAYNISPKLALMLQPSFKAASLTTRRIGNSETYYQVNDDGNVELLNAFATTVVPGGSAITANYEYDQTHDSIVKKYTIGGSYAEAELPILLKYNISKNFGVYGGVNIVYSKMISITQNTYTMSRILKDATSREVGDGYIPAPYKLDSLITYTGTPYPAGYTSPYAYSTESQFRVGYMLGFSYQFTGRWLLDGLIQQATATPNVQAGYNTNSALSAPYVRFTLGYKLLTK